MDREKLRTVKHTFITRSEDFWSLKGIVTPQFRSIFIVRLSALWQLFQNGYGALNAYDNQQERLAAGVIPKAPLIEYHAETMNNHVTYEQVLEILEQ